MIKPIPWANSLALTAAIFYIALWAVAAVAPTIFSLIFNAQFLGADVASLYSGQSLVGATATLVIVAITTWLVGYVWASIYNRLAK